MTKSLKQDLISFKNRPIKVYIQQTSKGLSIIQFYRYSDGATSSEILTGVAPRLYQRDLKHIGSLY